MWLISSMYWESSGEALSISSLISQLCLTHRLTFSLCLVFYFNKYLFIYNILFCYKKSSGEAFFWTMLISTVDIYTDDLYCAWYEHWLLTSGVTKSSSRNLILICLWSERPCKSWGLGGSSHLGVKWRGSLFPLFLYL